MAIFIVCDNRGCGKSSEALLDLEDKQVYCLECNKPITNITVFAKRLMESTKQIKKDSSRQSSPLEVRCSPCKKLVMPVLVNDKFVCSKCNEPLTINAVQANYIRLNLKKKNSFTR